MEPEQITDADELTLASINAFTSLCSEIDAPWMIKGRSKIYGSKLHSCTIVVVNKSFTERDINATKALQKSLEAASKFIIKTYAIFDEFRVMLEEKEKAAAKYCTPIPLEDFFKQNPFPHE